MLTPATTQVDAAPRAVMWSLSQIAERDGVSKQAISAAVKRLVASGLTVERDGRGHVKAVNVAQYDALRGQYGDPSKDQRPPKPDEQSPAKPGESFDEARRVGAWLDNEKARLALAKEKGEYVLLAGVAEALTEAGMDIARIIDRGVNAADDVAAACGRDGVHGVRTAMKALFARMRNEIADKLAKVAADAPAGTGEPQQQAANLQVEESAPAEAGA